jgi:hypothetical protein
MSHKGSSINRTRSVLYGLARFLGDFAAVKSGSPAKMARRVARRAVGRAVGRGMGKLFR